jgi:transcriptional regulator with XRE-family HTH domain
MFDLKSLRKDKNITQVELAEIFKVKQSFISQIESGKSSIPEDWITVLEAKFGNISKYKLSIDNDKDNHIITNTPQTITQKIRENKLFNNTQKGIIAVPIMAQANYSRHYDDVVYKNQLDRIFFPNSPYDGDDFRYFQIEGDSMEYVDETGRVSGIADGSWIIAERIPKEDWQRNLRQYYVYVIVTDSRITIKRILQDNEEELVLHADNELYGQERLAINEIKEIWIFKRKLDWNAPPPRKIEIKI